MRHFRLIGLLALLLPLISTCGGNSGPASPQNSGESIVSAWQTFCGSESGRVHRWTQTAGELTIERLSPVSSTFRQGFAFTRNGDLIAMDLTSGEQFRFDNEAGSFSPVTAEGCNQFVTATHSFAQEYSQVAACPIDGGECKTIRIADLSFPYVFAENNGRVLAATNYGDVLIFDGADWCRCSRSGDTYRCDPNEPMVEEPRRVQFYCSINYMGKTLVGEWPTGRLYEFNGEELRPADMLQPSFVTGEPWGYEAQSIAEYGGDLFVGYWPYGEIWRRHRGTGNWEMAARLFSHPVDSETFIPYAGQEEDGLYYSFYGQRVSALVPVGDSLYAVTANSNYWPVGYASEILTPAQAAEYGAFWRLKIPGCETMAIGTARTELRAKENLYRNGGCSQGLCAGKLPLIDRTRY